MLKICLVEDEEDLNKILSLYLERNNYECISCSTREEAMRHLYSDIDMWIVDIMLPDGSGIELLKNIKAVNKETPVIIISARGDSIDRLLGFEVGCDDYIPKPFLPEELIYRISKVFNAISKKPNIPKNIISVGPYKIDKAKRNVYIEDKIIDLTSREFDIILYFLSNKSKAISRGELLQRCWEEDYYGSDRVVDNYIKNIRKKLPYLSIETIYGFGYRYNS